MIVLHKRRKAADLARMLEAANAWPASERGDQIQLEGWEDMEHWERAMGIYGEQDPDERHVSDQKEWLAKVRFHNLRS